jgi:hypothetical protein
MPSPIAHSVAAALLSRWFISRPNVQPIDRKRIIGLCCFFSFAPDLDVIPGWIFGNLAAYHNQWTHSLLVGLVCCTMGALLWSAWQRRPALGVTLRIALISYGIHLLMDWTTRGRGLRLFWPFTAERFAMEPPVFVGLRWSEGWLSIHHLHTALNEIGIGAIVIAVLFSMHKFKQRQPHAHAD